MIVPVITIDTSDIMSQFTSLDKEKIDNMLDNIAKGLAAAYAQKLEEEAVRVLHQTRQRYIRNIRLVDSGKLEGTVLLDYSKDKLVQMLEEGAKAFDMKEYFLKSTKVKIGKNGGKYLTIPFRWGTPGIVGESDVFSGIMPTQIYKIVKNKPTDIPVSGGGTRSSGISLKELPAQFQVKKVRPSIANNEGSELWAAYQHKHPLHQGIVKQNDSVTGQNTYHAFRRVSENSDQDAFIHPGIQQYNLLQKTLAEFNIADEVGIQLDNELSKLGLI